MRAPDGSSPEISAEKRGSCAAGKAELTGGPCWSAGAHEAGVRCERARRICEDERSSSLLSEFEPLSSGPKDVVLDHDRDSTMISHDESLDMKNVSAP